MLLEEHHGLIYYFFVNLFPQILDNLLLDKGHGVEFGEGK